MKEINYTDVHSSTQEIFSYFRNFLDSNENKDYKIFLDTRVHFNKYLIKYVLEELDGLKFCDEKNNIPLYKMNKEDKEDGDEAGVFYIDGFAGIISIDVEKEELFIFHFHYITTEYGVDYCTFIGAKDIKHVEDLNKKVDDFEVDCIREISKTYVIQKPADKKISKEKFPTFESVILDKDLKDSIKNDIFNFLKSRKFYEERNIPYKRGIILCGPPGNGKTMMCKAIAKDCGVPFFNIFFKNPMNAHIGSIVEAYDEGSKYGPAIICIEDLDALFATDRNSGAGFSEFLNILDGINELNGIITIATTNHPETIDTAFINRPGRFDKVYNIPLPSTEHIQTYYKLLFKKLTDSEIQIISKGSRGFSFAQLKEIYISSNLLCYESNDYPSLDIINKQIKHTCKNMKAIKNAFENKDSMGFNS